MFGRRLHVDEPSADTPARRLRTPSERTSRGDRDPLTFGTGVVASFLAPGAAARSASRSCVSHPVTELLPDDAGARRRRRVADGPDGRVERRGPVVLATSTYDWDPELVREFLGLEPEDFGSVAPRSLRGDGIRWPARSAATSRRSRRRASRCCRAGRPRRAGLRLRPRVRDAALHDRRRAPARRFCDDSYWLDIVAQGARPGRPPPAVLPGLGRAAPPQVRPGRHAAGRRLPGGLVTSAPTLAELGAALGHRRRAARAHRRRVQRARRARRGPRLRSGTVPFVRRFAGDPAHGPTRCSAPIAEPPFYGMRLRIVGTGIGSSGVHIDGDGHVLDDARAADRGPVRRRLVRGADHRPAAATTAASRSAGA